MKRFFTFFGIAALLLAGTPLRAQSAPPCRLDPDKLTYDLYIINPNGSERHTPGPFVRSYTTAEGLDVVNFEDSFIDNDFNDVVIDVDRRSLPNIHFTFIKLSALWHHQVLVDVFYEGNLLLHQKLWEDSHTALGRTVSVDLTSSTLYSQVCTIDPACVLQCNQAGLYLYIVNPNGSVRKTLSRFTRTEKLGNRHYRIFFEDSGSDDDFNDVVVNLDASNCGHVRVKVESFAADWIHQIRAEVIYKGAVVSDLSMWPHSLAAVGEERTIDLGEYIRLCVEN